MCTKVANQSKDLKLYSNTYIYIQQLLTDPLMQLASFALQLATGNQVQQFHR